ncbi:hypothetical protein NliqN6_0333 [Naganishia liquefaciens]|uniref:Oxysterol-binding protein n=1 Tax=Naganishia liquefaciens TaxID=104408 RepID=A0A8H3TNE3_9TREE|nr:hypothetical protein NliqN6_0333 [Naganishia liquefaciens]
MPRDIPAEDDPTVHPVPFLATEEDEAPATLPESTGEQSKIKTILGLLKKLIGVADVANLRLSLPASLLEPIPNLEYWSYCDRADFFAALGDSPDEFERMLGVLRFAFSKELKFVRQRIGKPYNSALGEHFRCHWRVPPVTLHPKTNEPVVKAHRHDPTNDVASSTNSPALGPSDMRDDVSIRSSASKTSARGQKPIDTLPRSMSALNLQNGAGSSTDMADKEDIVVFLCEQVSHHPPISSAYYACPSKGVEMTCVDQIAAKVSGMTVQVTPGEANKGLFIDLKEPSPGAGEEYQLTHPTAQVNGIIKGSFYGTISDNVLVTCRGARPGKKLKTIIEYKDEPWLGKPKFALEGVIFSYNPDKPEEEEWSKIKNVPADRILANLEGSWRKQIKYRRKGEKEWKVLIDLEQLDLTPRSVRPLEQQEERESRRLWDPVTSNMLSKNWSEATKQKQTIEQRQRDLANQRKQQGVEHKPVYFEEDISTGKPILTSEGRKAFNAELERAKGE